MSRPALSQFTEFGRKIIGVGANFKAQMKEMNIPQLREPRLFLKAPSSYIFKGQRIQYPEWSKEGIYYGVHLGVVIQEPLRRANVEKARYAIGGYCVALDMTDVERLSTARMAGLSWALAKSFDTACPVGELIPVEELTELNDVNLFLKVNGRLQQHGNTSDMVWPVVQLVSIISEFCTLEYGDMILTGTPAGVGIAKKGDVIEAGIRNFDSVEFIVDNE